VPRDAGPKSAAKDVLAAADALFDPAAALPVGEPVPGYLPDGVPAPEPVVSAWSAGTTGSYHRDRAVGTAERARRSDVYGKTAGTLHGGAAAPARAAGVYREVLSLTRELLVAHCPARVLELSGLGAAEAREVAGPASRHRMVVRLRSGDASYQFTPGPATPRDRPGSRPALGQI
jgi:hypothetical protein